MAIIHYQPWAFLDQLQKEFERSRDTQHSDDSVATAEWTPAVDIKEEADKFVLHADIPGVSPDVISVNMEAGVLTLKGEKNTEAKVEKDGYKRIERSSGSFYRRFSLPDSADAEAISAKCKNGVLEIVIPKREAVKPKKIEVAVEA